MLPLAGGEGRRGVASKLATPPVHHGPVLAFVPSEILQTASALVEWSEKKKGQHQGNWESNKQRSRHFNKMLHSSDGEGREKTNLSLVYFRTKTIFPASADMPGRTARATDCQFLTNVPSAECPAPAAKSTVSISICEINGLKRALFSMSGSLSERILHRGKGWSRCALRSHSEGSPLLANVVMYLIYLMNA